MLMAVCCLASFANGLHAQKIDSLFFNLYTDSLKKGTFNYINVDGKTSEGRWLPLTSKQLRFSATSGRFEGNSLFIEQDFTGEKVTVKTVMLADSSISRTITIYIKKNADNERLKTAEEIKKEIDQGTGTRKRKGGK